MNKRGYEFSFTWIFTIFVGATVIFFAIFFAMRLIDTNTTGINTAEGKSLGILLTPVETQIEQGKSTRIYLAEETKFFFECEKPEARINPFGSQILRLSIKDFSGRSTDDNTNDLTFHNKYIFSSNEIYGKDNLYLLSKPLFLPYKTADLLMIWSDEKEYCFQGLSRLNDLKEELGRLNLGFVKISTTDSPCNPDNQIVVCFDGPSDICEIVVSDGQNKVWKKEDNSNLFYFKPSRNDQYSLMLAAIFSDSNNYYCQMQRIFAHASILADLYKKKSERLIAQSGCSQNLWGLLDDYGNFTSSASENFNEDSAQSIFRQFEPKMVELGRENGFLQCPLF